MRNLLRGEKRLGLVKFVISLFGANIPNIINLVFPNFVQPIQSIIMVLGILIVIYIIFIYVDTDAEDFDSGSPREAEFFEKFYSRSGELLVFCNDLYWLENEVFLRVVNAIKNKGNRAKVYIKRLDSKIVNELEFAGVAIHKIPESIRSEHTFSILFHEGFKSIIIRDKTVQTDKIRIKPYYDNPSLVNLALDMLDANDYSGEGY